MNKFVASVSLVALGAASAQAQSTTPGQNASISGPAPKWWNISATVRGFYDDNANTAATGSGLAKVATFGYELSPSVGLSIGNQQTTFTANYVFDYVYYDHDLLNPDNGANKVPNPAQKRDYVHTFTANLNHAFSERYSVQASDSFVIGQQPDVLRAGNAVQTFQRIAGDNIVNSGGITFNGELTPVFG